MNQQEKFNDTVGILVKAYLNDTLEPTDCAKCAVGNMVAAANGYKTCDREITADWIAADGQTIEPQWQDVIWAKRDEDEGFYRPTIEGHRQIESTGYSLEDFDRIEEAFMSGLHEPLGNGTPNNYNGLMAVVDVLADIHGIDLATAAASKALFVKA